MYLSEEDKRRLFDKTEGRCNYCGKQLAFENRGLVEARGAWEADHKIPRSQGGCDDMSNLVAACFACNRDKSDLSAVSYRRLTRSVRVGRENAAIARELESVSIPLAGLTYVACTSIADWLDDRRRRRATGIQNSLQLNELPWVGICAILIGIVIVVQIVKSNRGS